MTPARQHLCGPLGKLLRRTGNSARDVPFFVELPCAVIHPENAFLPEFGGGGPDFSGEQRGGRWGGELGQRAEECWERGDEEEEKELEENPEHGALCNLFAIYGGSFNLWR